MHCTIIAALFLATGPGEFEAPGARVRVEIESHAYDWHVTNTGRHPIDRFEIEQWNMYGAELPPGWLSEITERSFTVWTDEIHQAIAPGDTSVFTARVSSYGAALTTGTAVLGTTEGEQITIEGVWRPTRQSRAVIAMVALLLVAIAATHMLLTRDALPQGPRTVSRSGK